MATAPGEIFSPIRVGTINRQYADWIGWQQRRLLHLPVAIEFGDQAGPRPCPHRAHRWLTMIAKGAAGRGAMHAGGRSTSSAGRIA